MASRVQRSSERNVRTQVRQPVEALRCLRQHTEGGLGRPQSGEATRSSCGSGDRYRGRTDIRGVRGRCTPGCQPGRRLASSTGSFDRRGYPSEKGLWVNRERNRFRNLFGRSMCNRDIAGDVSAKWPRTPMQRVGGCGPVAPLPGECGSRVKPGARTCD